MGNGTARWRACNRCYAGFDTLPLVLWFTVNQNNIKGEHSMQLNGKVLAGTTTTITTKKGTALDKTRLKVLDIGEEVAGDVSVYWIDFIGDTALTEDELAAVSHEEVVIEIRRISASGSNGKTYLNLTGGAVLHGGMPVQAKLLKDKGKRV